MLTAAPTVPHGLSGEVLGLDGTKVWPMVAAPGDRCVLWVVAGDMAGAQLDLDGVEALQQLLGEVAAVMRRAVGKILPTMTQIQRFRRPMRQARTYDGIHAGIPPWGCKSV